MVGLAARHADIFQFTGLVHGEGGQPGSGGFPIEQVRDRARVFDEAAGDRIADIERSALVQMTVVGSEAESRMAEAVERTGFDRSVLEETPFMLLGSIEQIVDKMERLREDVGISHYVIRDLDEFEPIIERLAGR